MICLVQALAANDLMVELRVAEQAALYGSRSHGDVSELQPLVEELLETLALLVPPDEVPTYLRLKELAAKLPTWAIDDIIEDVRAGSRVFLILAKRLDMGPVLGREDIERLPPETQMRVYAAYDDAAKRFRTALLRYEAQLLEVAEVCRAHAAENDPQWERELERPRVYALSDAEADRIRPLVSLKPEEAKPTEALIRLFRRGR
jgi:hypothetical protein